MAMLAKWHVAGSVAGFIANDANIRARTLIRHYRAYPYDEPVWLWACLPPSQHGQPRYRVRCPAPRWPAFRVTPSWPAPRPSPELTRPATAPSACATTWPAARHGLCLAAGFPLFAPV